MVWYSDLFKNFPQFVSIHTVKRLFHSQRSRSACFPGIPLLSLWSNECWQFDLWFLCLSKSGLYIWQFLVHILLNLVWRILNITLLACKMSATVWYLEHSLALPFFGTGMKTDLFQSCGYCWVFQIYWHIEYSTFTASSFRIWNSSAGILSPPLALFLVVLPKAHLTSYSRMSSSRWVTISWLSRSLRCFLYILLCILATSS